jgi:hypothetical protein
VVDDDRAHRDRADIAVDRPEWAARAQRAYGAMQAGFCSPAGRYRPDGRLALSGSSAHLWPFARAFVATLDLAGMATPPDGCDAGAAIAQRLLALERYWDARGPHPAYASDTPGKPWDGDRYYDDNAWVGLALAQLERMRPGSGRLDRAVQLYAFAVSGWDTDPGAPHPGGVFWLEQGRGAGRRNHDRNTVSTAPNAQLGLHLEQLGAAGGGEGPVGPEQMYDWVNRALDAAGDGTGLFWDKVRGDGTIDHALWSYNQGNMVGLNVLLARRAQGGARAAHLARAAAIADRALAHSAGEGLDRQPPAFNAIFLRNLLLLHAATSDEPLRAGILDALAGYADHLWAHRRDRRDRFARPDHPVTLLDQSAAVSVLALAAWDPDDYVRLA